MKMTLSKNAIDLIFEEAKNQHDYLIRLYKIVIIDFEKAKHILGHPQGSARTIGYLFDKAKEFDKKNHPGVLPGGLMMNAGFSESDEITQDWIIDTAKVTIIYSNELNNASPTDEEIVAYHILKDYFHEFPPKEFSCNMDEYKRYLTLKAKYTKAQLT